MGLQIFLTIFFYHFFHYIYKYSYQKIHQIIKEMVTKIKPFKFASCLRKSHLSNSVRLEEIWKTVKRSYSKFV